MDNKSETWTKNPDGSMELIESMLVPVDPDQVRRDEANDVIARRRAGGVGEVTDSDVIDALLVLRG